MAASQGSGKLEASAGAQNGGGPVARDLDLGSCALMGDFDLRPRMITAAEFAEILRVTEDDVLRWMLAGRIPYTDGSEGEPRVRILEQHAVEGPITSGLISYSISRDPEFQAEVASRRRELELQTMDWDEVELEALAHALAVRLRAVAPSVCRVVVEKAMIWLRDADGHGAGIDIAFAASFPDSGSGAERVRSAAGTALQQAQDELAITTTDPWPRRGSGELPAPRAELTSDGATVRLLYGDPADPVLELEPIHLSEVLARSSS
jgi:hypothetical protein